MLFRLLQTKPPDVVSHHFIPSFYTYIYTLICRSLKPGVFSLAHHPSLSSKSSFQFLVACYMTRLGGLFIALMIGYIIFETMWSRSYGLDI